MTARRRRGFGQLASVSPASLGLPARRARDLRLQVAWRRIAGAAVAARAPAVAVRRGVLEIRRPDERWAPTLGPMIPELAARLARDEPSLGITALRVRAAGERGVPSEPVDPAPRAETDAAPARVAGRPPARTRPRTAPSTPTLDRVRAAYLARQKP